MRNKIRIMIATSEPWGTYHARYVMPQLLSNGVDASHLVPDITNLAKPGFGRASDSIPVSVGLASVCEADLLVINCLSAASWPTKAAAMARQAGVPIVFSHLAYLGDDLQRGKNFDLAGITAPSDSDALNVASHLGIAKNRVLVVGTPALDLLPMYNPTPASVLIVTSVTSEIQGPNMLLIAANALKDRGVILRIALHPRENPEIWEGFEIAKTDTLVSAATASVVIGTPGSIFPSLAALGVPMLRIVNESLDKSITRSILALATPLLAPALVMQAMDNIEKPTRSQVEFLVGPTPGATQRLVKVWISAAKK